MTDLTSGVFNFQSLEITTSPSTFILGSNVTLTCTARLLLQNTSQCNYLSCAKFGPWIYMGVQLYGSSSEEFSNGVLVATSELQLNFINTSDVGTYHCKLKHGLSSNVQSITLSG